ncbi:ABC transporter substrate-binding protein [Nitrospinota bacterium]
MRKWIVLFVFLILSWVAASGAYAYQGKLTVALKAVSPTMDPHPKSNFIGTMIWRWAYDTLVSAEAGTGKRLPWLATKWKIHSPKKVEFWLRKGVKFADGSSLTAENVKFSMNRVMDKKSRQRVLFSAFDRIEIIDDHRFIWHSKVADNGLLTRLGRYGHIMSLKAKGVDWAIVSRKTFGSGPYLLKEWVKGRKMVFEANPAWWGNSLYPNRAKTIVLRGIKEPTTRVKSLLKGEVDIIMGVKPQFAPQIKEQGGLALAVVPAVRIMYLTFVTRHGGPFGNQKVRLAVNYAVDAELLRKTVLGGLGDLWGSFFHPWNYSGYNPNDKWYGYDLAKAKALMKEAGYPNGFKATLYGTIGRYPADVKTCEAVAGFLKKIKIDAPCRTMPYGLWKKTRNAFQKGTKKSTGFFLQAYGNGAGDPANISIATQTCKGHASVHCFKDVDEAVHKAASTPDPKEQQIAFEKVTALIKKKAMFKVLYKIRDIFGYKKGLGFKPRHDETFFAWEIDMKKPRN